MPCNYYLNNMNLCSVYLAFIDIFIYLFISLFYFGVKPSVLRLYIQKLLKEELGGPYKMQRVKLQWLICCTITPVLYIFICNLQILLEDQMEYWLLRHMPSMHSHLVQTQHHIWSSEYFLREEKVRSTEEYDILESG